MATNPGPVPVPMSPQTGEVLSFLALRGLVHVFGYRDGLPIYGLTVDAYGQFSMLLAFLGVEARAVAGPAAKAFQAAAEDLMLKYRDYVEDIAKQQRGSAPEGDAHSCEKDLEAIHGPLTAGTWQEGTVLTCRCGKSWVHVCDESEGCSWVPHPGPGH